MGLLLVALVSIPIQRPFGRMLAISFNLLTIVQVTRAVVVAEVTRHTLTIPKDTGSNPHWQLLLNNYQLLTVNEKYENKE